MSALALKSPWAVVKAPNQWLLCDVAHDPLIWFALEPENALVLSSLDGRTTHRDLLLKLARVFRLTESLADQIVRETVSRFRQCLSDTGQPQRPRAMSWAQDLTGDRLSLARGSAPVQISLVLTEKCNRTCRYCYMNAKHVASGSIHLDMAPLIRLIDEAQSLAVQGFSLLGGEPMLFDNSIELVNELLERNFDVRIATKNRFDVSRLTAVNRQNLHLEISLDSLDPGQVAYYTGSETAFADAMASCADLRRAGIGFVIKMVVGRPNRDAILPMIRFAKDHGATSLNIIEFERSFGRNDDHLPLTDADRHVVLRVADEGGRELCQKVEVIFLDGLTDYKWCPPGARDESVPAVYCDQGIRTLTILPNGDATCCIALPMHRQIRAENVYSDGIYNVWNRSPTYLGLVKPTRAMMGGTLCAECDDFDYCNWTGRCQMQAMKWHGELVGPDRRCARYMEMQQ